MTPAAILLADLAGRGVTVETDGQTLRYRPRSAVTPADLNRLRKLKDELIAVLSPPSPAWVDGLERLFAPPAVRPAPRCIGSPHLPECVQHAGPVLRPTAGGPKLFCPVCCRRIGLDQKYPW